MAPATVIRISVAATSTEAPRVLACSGLFVVIGRSERCDLVLRAPGVSGMHCRVSRMDGIDGAYVLEDLGSTYGTHVNGTKIDRPVVVSSQDAIAVGGHSIRIVDEATSGARRRPAPDARPTRGAVRVSEWQAHYDRFDAAAQLWHAHGRPRARLLRGSDLAVAEAWLRAGRGQQPAPQPLHRDFVAHSRSARRRRTAGGLAATTGVLAGAAVGFVLLFEPQLPTVVAIDEAVPSAVDAAVDAPTSASTEPGPWDVDTLVEASLHVADPEQRLALQGEIARVAIGAGQPFSTGPAWALQQSAHDALAGMRSVVLRDHERAVIDVDWDPRGRWVVSGSADHTAKIWDLSRPAPTIPTTLHGHVGELTAIAVSPTGRWLLTASEDRTVRRWDLEASDPGATGVVLRGHEATATEIAFDPTGRWAVTGDRSGALLLWDVEAEQPATAPSRQLAHEGPITDLLVLPGGRQLVSAGDDRGVRRWTIADGVLRASVRLEGAASGITRLCASRSARWLAAAGTDGIVLLWDLREDSAREPLVLAGHVEGVNDVAITPDEHFLVSGGDDDTLRVWDLSAKDPSVGGVVLSGHTGDIMAVRIAAGGKKVVSTALDNTLRVWDLGKKDLVVDEYALHGHTADIHALALAPDGLQVATASEDGTVRLWDVLARKGGASSKTLRGHASQIADAALDPAGERLLVTGDDGRAELWDVRDRARNPVPVRLVGQSGLVNAAAFDPLGRYAATGTETGEIRLWPLAEPGAPRIAREGHRGAVNRIAFTSDGARLVSIGSDGTTRLWQTEGSAESLVLATQRQEVHALVLAPDGRYAFAGSDDGTIMRWDLQAEDVVASATALMGHEDGIFALAISPDGRLLASTSADGRARIWDVARGKVLHVLRQHDDAVTAAAFSSDGRRLATGSSDRRILVWKIDAAHPDENPRELVGHEQSITDLRFVEGSTMLASASNDGTVRLWHLEAGTVTTLHGHDQVVRELLLTRDAEWLVSVGDDGSARLWPLTATSFAARICEAVGVPAPAPLRAELFGASASETFCVPTR